MMLTSPPPPPPPTTFNHREKERDEFAEQCEAIFDSIDTDGSGALGLDELELMLERLGMKDVAERKQHAHTLMADLDDDMSGEIDKAEFMSAVRRGALDNLLHPPNAADTDADSDGATELTTGRDRIGTDSRSLEQRRRSQNAADARAGRSPMVTRARGNGGGGGGGRSGRGELTEEKLKHLRDIFNLADEDGTGSIGIEELMDILQDESITGRAMSNLSTEFVQTVMDTIDTDGNGELDFDEFVQAFQDIITSDGDTAEDKSLFAAQNKALLNEMEELQARLKLAQEETQEVKQAHAHMVEEMQTRLEDAQESAQIEMDRMSRETKKINKENRKLKDELKLARQTVEKLEAAMEDVKAEASRLEFQRRMSSAGGNFESLDDLLKELERLRKENSQLESKLQLEGLRARDTEEELRAQVVGLTNKLAGYEKDIDRIDQLRSQLAYLEQSNQELRAELDELRKRGGAGGETLDFETKTRSLPPPAAAGSGDDLKALQAEFDKFKEDTRLAWEQVQQNAKTQRDQAEQALVAMRERAEKAELALAAQQQDGDAQLQAALDQARHDLEQAQLELQRLKDAHEQRLNELEQQLARAEDARQLADDQKAAAEGQLEDFKARTAQEWEAYKAQADKDLAGIMDDLAAARTAQQNAETELQALQAATKDVPSAQEIAALQAQLQATKAELDKALRNLADAQAQAQAEKDRQAEEAERERQRLLDEIEDHKTRYGIAAAQLDALKAEDDDANKTKLAEMAALKESLAKSSAALAAAESELKRAQRDADDSRRRAEELARAEVERLAAERDDLARKQAAYNQELEALKGSLPGRDKEIQGLRERLAATRTDLEEAEAALRAAKLAAAESADRLRADLQAQMDALRDERDAACRRQAEAEGELAAIQRAVADKTQADSEVAARVQDLQAQREASLARLGAVDDSARALRMQLQALQNKLAASDAEAAALRQAKSKTERMLDSEIQSLRDQHRRTQDERDRVEAELARARRDAEDERQRERDALQALLDKAQREVDAAQDRQAELEGELARLKRRYHRHMSGSDLLPLPPAAAAAAGHSAHRTTTVKEEEDETIEVISPGGRAAQLGAAPGAGTTGLTTTRETVVEDELVQSSTRPGAAAAAAADDDEGNHERCRYHTELVEAHEEIEVLKRKLAAAERDLASGQAAAQDRDAKDLELVQLRQQLEAATAKAAYAEQQLAALRQQLEANEDETEVLNGQLAKAKTELSELRAQLAQAEKAARELQEQLRDLDEARGQADQQARRVQERDTALSQVQAELDKTRSKLDAALQEAEEHRQAGRTAQRDLRTLQGDHDMLRGKHQDAAAQLEQANELMAQLRAKIRALEAQVGEAEVAKSEVETQASAHHRNLSERVRETEELRTEIETLKRANEDAADDVHKAKGRERRLQQQIEELTVETTSGRQRVAALEREVAEARAEAAVLRDQQSEEVGRLRQQLGDAEAALARARKELANLKEDTKREVERTKAAAEREVANLEAAATSAKRRQQAAEDELVALRERMARENRERSVSLDQALLAAGDGGDDTRRKLRHALEELETLRATEEDKTRQVTVLKRQLAEARALQRETDDELFDLRAKKARLDLSEDMAAQLAAVQTDLNDALRQKAALEGELEGLRQQQHHTSRTRNMELVDEEERVTQRRAQGADRARLEAENVALRAQAAAADRKRELAELELEHYRGRDGGDAETLRKLLDAANQEIARLQREVARLQALLDAQQPNGHSTRTKHVTEREIVETSLLKTENQKLREALSKGIKPMSSSAKPRDLTLPESPGTTSAPRTTAPPASSAPSTSGGRRNHHTRHTRRVTEYIDSDDDESVHSTAHGGRRQYQSSRAGSTTGRTGHYVGNLEGWTPGRYKSPAQAHAQTRTFPVTIWDSHLAQAHGLAQRPAWLQVGPEGLAILSQTQHDPLAAWPLHHVKCYGMDRNVFSFEIGRRSGAPGVVYLATTDYPALFDALDALVH